MSLVNIIERGIATIEIFYLRVNVGVVVSANCADLYVQGDILEVSCRETLKTFRWFS